MLALRRFKHRSIDRIGSKGTNQFVFISRWVVVLFLLFIILQITPSKYGAIRLIKSERLPAIPELLFITLTSSSSFKSTIRGFAHLSLREKSCIVRFYTTMENDFVFCSSRLSSWKGLNDSGCHFEVWYQKIIRMWGDIHLENVHQDTKVIFVKKGALISNRAVSWFNLAHEQIQDFHQKGGKRDIVGISVGCKGEATPNFWWAHTVGPLNNTCAFSPLRGEREDLWEFFVTWFNTRRREWLQWPHIWDSDISVPFFWKGKNKNRRDRRLTKFGAQVGKDYSFAGDPDLTWEKWFLRFAANYTLRVLTAETNLDMNDDAGTYHNSGRDSAVQWQNSPSDSSITSYGDSVTVGDIWYEPVDAEFGWGYFNALKTIVNSKQTTISITMVSSKFLELTRSWLCNVQHGNIQPPNIYWITLDEKSEKELESTGVGTTVNIRDSLAADNMDSVNILYGQPAYWKLMLTRTRLIRDLLDRGIDVFLFETDQVWLCDPLEYIKKEIDAGADLVGTLDTQHNVAGNTILLRSTISTRKMWGEVYLRFKKSYDKKQIETKGMHSVTFVEHDQFQLSDLSLYNSEFVQSYPIALGLLNSQKFVGGSWYMGMYSSEEARTPVVINNNFISGTRKKKSRAISFGHWFLKEDGRTCDLTAINKAMKYEFAKNPKSFV